jgi:hypothetical protein
MQHYKTIRSRLLASGLALVSFWAFTACDITSITDPSDDAGGNATAVAPFSFTVNVANQNRFRIEGINGIIDIVGVLGATTVEIRGERRVRSKSEDDARDYLRNLEVRVTDSNNEVFVKTVQPQETHGRNLEVTYYIRIPVDWETIANNANGNVLVDSLAGKVAVALANGNVQMREISGNLTISLTNGNVSLAAITGGTLVSLVNGNIIAGVTLPQNAACEMNTVNGTIALRIPQSTSALFSAEVTNGVINVTGLVMHDTITSPKSVSGRLAEGRGKIALKTVNGNIGVTGL